ncbi:MAG: WD40 repeat domain-containing serine/threonine protein kinase [Terriglobales bacterium]
MTLTPGTKLGPYEIVGTLGAGGMGEVYRARDPRLGREVAVKVLPAAMAGDAQALRRMEQEARAIAALNHPNLLSVHELGQTPEGLPYIVSELLEGESLRERLRSGALGQRRAVEYAIQIARGLAAAHDKGIVHRDLKPENIFVCGDGRIKILDFGLAKLSAAVSAEDVTAAGPGAGTAPGVVLGTMGYMAPEQVRGQATDARSDIFSFGAVLYEMLAGRRPFAGDSAADVMSAILKEEPPELSVTGGGIAPALERIVRHCLEKQPRQRFQSADDIAFQLTELGGATTSAGSAAGAVAVPAEHRRWWPFAAVALVLVGLGWFGRGVLGPHAAPPPQMEALTYRKGLVGGAAFLPGGQGFVASIRFSGTDYQLYTGQIGTPGLQPLNVRGYLLASLSRAGSALLLQQGPNYGFNGAGTLAEMPLSGGAPRALMDHIGAVTWDPAGTAFAIARHVPASPIESLEYPPGHVIYRPQGWVDGLQFSPDGHEIAFLDHPAYGDNRGRVAIVDLAGHERTLSPEFSSIAGLAWAPGGGELWFTATNRSDYVLYGVSTAGKLRRLYSAPASITLDAVAPDGRLLLASGSVQDGVRLISQANPAGTDLSVLSYTVRGLLSADGKQVLVDDDYASANYANYLRGADGSPPVRLGDGNVFALSPDARWAVSISPDLHRLTLEPTGAGQPRVLVDSALEFNSGHFVPGGDGLLALGLAPGHQPRTYMVALSGGVRPVTPEGVMGTVPTLDGKAVLADTAAHVWALYPLAGGPPQPVAAILPKDHPLRFAASGELYVAVYGPQALTAQIFRLDLAHRTRQLLYTVAPTDAGLRSIVITDITLDGRTFTYNYAVVPSTLYQLTGLH